MSDNNRIILLLILLVILIAPIFLRIVFAGIYMLTIMGVLVLLLAIVLGNRRT